MPDKFLMPARLLEMPWAVEGFTRSGTLLIAYQDGLWRQAGIPGDDPGASLFIPLIVYYLDIPLPDAFYFLYSLILLSALIIGCLGIWFCFQSRVVRISAILILGIYSIRTLSYYTDVYLIPSVIVLALFPWLMYWIPKQPKPGRLTFFIAAGFLCGLGNFMRIHAGTGILVIAFFGFLCWDQTPWKVRWKSLAGIAGGFLLFMFIQQGIYFQRDQFLIQHGVQPTKISDQHVFWHQVYLGLGFIDNRMGIRFKDEVAMAKVESIRPDTEYVSQEYEAILRGEVFRIWRSGTPLIVHNIAAKAGILFYYFLLYANVGALALIKLRPDFKYHLPFLAGFGILGLPVLLTVPRQSYLLGFFMISMMYGLTGLNEYFNQGGFSELKERFIPSRNN